MGKWEDNFPSVEEVTKYWVLKQSGFQRFLDFKKDMLVGRKEDKLTKLNEIKMPHVGFTDTQRQSMAGADPQCLGTGNEKAWCPDCPWLNECAPDKRPPS